MATKHTPGPWFVRDFRESYMRELGWTGPSIDRILITNKTGSEIVESAGENCVVARIQFDNRTEPLGESNLADACLIAAAPELLDGCKALLGLLELIGGRDDVSTELRDVLATNHRVAEARAAIAKAEGR
jgi:hypothetical protein